MNRSSFCAALLVLSSAACPLAGCEEAFGLSPASTAPLVPSTSDDLPSWGPPAPAARPLDPVAVAPAAAAEAPKPAAIAAPPPPAMAPAPDVPAVALAEGKPLNEVILSIMETYPKDGSNPYRWKRGTDTDGGTRDIVVGGVQVASRDQGGEIHCSGITWEVYLRALERAAGGDIAALVAPETLLALKQAWYIREGGESGLVDALASRGLGQRITRVEDLKPGDFVQFWRNTNKGHSAVFVRHTYNSNRTIRGLVFWSAQASSGGIGQRIVSIGAGEFQIAPGRLYGVRAILPAAK